MEMERSISGVLTGELVQRAGQRWDSSQVECEPEERDVMDWLMDDELIDEAVGRGW